MILFYRNLKEVTAIEGVQVDEGALWLKEGELFVLVDDDQYVSHAITDGFVID